MVVTSKSFVALAAVAAAMTTLPSVSAQWKPDWKVGSGGIVMWENECDFAGGDLYTAYQPGELCGEVCANDPKCTHWVFVPDYGCYMKGGAYGAPTYGAKLACGYVVGRFYPFMYPPPPTVAPPSNNNGLSAEENQAMLTSINALRASSGLSALTIDARLQRAATKHSQDQASRCVVSKTSSNGRVLGDRLTAEGYSPSVAVENVVGGYTTVPDAMSAWIYSLADRTNLLNAQVTHVGFAKATNANCADSKTFWTQDLARP